MALEQTIYPLLILSAESAHSAINFLPIFLVICAAFLVPILLSKINGTLPIPVVVGEIFLGIIAGQIFPDLKSSELLEIFFEVGFGFLFFLAGTEINFQGARGKAERKRTGLKRFLSPFTTGLIVFSGTAIISFGLCYLLYQRGILGKNNWFFMAIVLLPTSLGIGVAVLKEKGYASTAYGQMLLMSATVADFSTVLILAVIAPVLQAEQNGESVDWFGIGLIGIIFVVFLLSWGLIKWLYDMDKISTALAKINKPTSPIKLRFSFVIFFGFLVLSQLVHAEIVLGTFMAGILINLVSKHEDHDVIHSLESIGFSFLIPIFFVMIGIRFNVQALIDSWQEALTLVPLLLIIAILNKLLPSLFFRYFYSMRETVMGGMLLTARISLIVAAAQIGVNVGIFSPAQNAALIVLAMLMATIGPLFFNRFMPEPEEDLPPPIIIAEAGRLGLELARQLIGHGDRVILIDTDAIHLDHARNLGFTAIEGYVDRPDERVSEYLDAAEKFVTTHNDSATNYDICRYVKTHYAIPHIVAEVANPKDLSRFEALGVAATNPVIDRTALFVMLTRSPSSYNLMTRTDDDKDVYEVLVHNPNVIGKAMRQLSLPQGLLVMALTRGGEAIVPNGDTRLQANDSITIVGPHGHQREMYQMFTAHH